MVTNGSVRDIPASEEAGFHLFAGNVSVSHSYIHIIEIGNPVEIGGLRIQSGELLHGDLHEVQSVPLELAARIPPVAAQIKAKEQALIALCRSPQFSLDKVRAAFQKARS